VDNGSAKLASALYQAIRDVRIPISRDAYCKSEFYSIICTCWSIKLDEFLTRSALKFSFCTSTVQTAALSINIVQFKIHSPSGSTWHHSP
jgi:hypothetical protein